MSFFQLVFTLLTVCALSVGQILFKMAANELDFSNKAYFFGFLNLKLLIALFVYFCATFMWLIVLKGAPLRVAYPFASLAFFLVPILAHFLLGEHIKWNTFAGAGFIAVGVWVSVYK